ncbi:MAG: ABC transporter permease, partial [Cytophagales bacterium]
MLANYLLLALRNIAKQRGYAIVNILGLAVGLAASLFIVLYVRDELTFDTMHPAANQTYRMGYVVSFPNGEKEAAPYAPAGWDNYLQANFPGIGGITSYTSWGMPTSIQYVAKDRILLTEELIWAESSITDLIYLPIHKGDSQKPLKGINSIVLTESAAKELFGDDDPLNQMVTVVHNWATQGKKVEMMVTAVIKDLPSNSHVRPRFVANILALKPFMPDLENLLNTSMADGNNNLFTQSYFVCNDATRIPAILDDMQKKVDAIIAKNKWDVKFKPVIRKITDVHFDSEMDWTIDQKTADIKYMYVFITIAVLILVVACIN